MKPGNRFVYSVRLAESKCHGANSYNAAVLRLLADEKALYSKRTGPLAICTDRWRSFLYG